MCGIAGWIDFSKDLSSFYHIIESMTDTLKLRGPNSGGFYTNENVLLGHRRLVVVDPEGGSQPMTKVINGNEYVLVYNGELYNTEDLRKDLLSYGYKFDSYSDTEVLLTSYIHWGIDCLDKFNGIFAFCIFNKKTKEIFLARDPLGVKPLFYSVKGNSLIFGSEIKTLLAHPYISTLVDETGITELLSLGPATALGSGIFNDIDEVPPGNFITFSPKEFNLKEYWTLKAEEYTENEDEAVEHLESLLVDAISRQLVGDVPLCTFLSGGLDSSAIAAVASKNFKDKGKKLTTYSIDFEDNENYFKASLFQPTSDEEWALFTSKYIDSNHKTIMIKNIDLVSYLKDALIAKDLPGMADIDSSLFLACKEIRKDYVVALSGECADEIFGGYPWFTNKDMYKANTFPWSRFTSNRLDILSPNMKNLKIEEMVNYHYNASLAKVPHLDNENSYEHRMRELFYLNIKWFMVNLLNRKDRMSMSNSLEVRVPFADPRLVQYAFNIPSKIKFLHGREKGLLRSSLKNILPKEIVERKKSPYPKTYHPIYTEAVCKEMNKILNNPSSPILEIVDKTKIQQIVDSKGESYKIPWYGQLMMGPQFIAYLIQLNMWLDIYNVNIKI
ncbi:asparagine synthase (glutamine-hydrolyzing) [Clostridium intestinale]|uniref:asparagine synthase (glutamine-hydrolyzing) n=1 Tax=Clostridium intestinale DSM 6191 TaxID=1121320 RepID=A0A1M6E6P2_9CLOT|nr:asparagine synthase (glutamine-hydrolyzing) [Clostridium intestinale]SHI81166.1 asparagine synthase (glutamine-hydrolysing) [Clostridium intestinale DSM 6191]